MFNELVKFVIEFWVNTTFITHKKQHEEQDECEISKFVS